MSSSPLRRSTRHMKPAEKDIPSAQPIDTDAPPSASSLNTNLTIKDSKKLSSSTINPRAARFMPTRGLAERRVLFNPKPKSPSTDSPDTDKAKNGKKPKLSSCYKICIKPNCLSMICTIVVVRFVYKQIGYL